MQKIKDIFLKGDLVLARLTVSIASLTWAGILLGLGYQFDRPAYVHLAAIAPQWVWGVLFLSAGALQFIRVLRGIPVIEGFYASTVAGLIAWMWCAVATALAISITPPPAIVSGNIAIAFLSGIIFIRTVARRE